MFSPLLFGVLLTIGVLLLFVGIWRSVDTRDPVEDRLKEYGVDTELDAAAPDAGRRRKWPGMTRLLAGFGLGPVLAITLVRADVALTAAEFAVLIVIIGMVGFSLGVWRGGLLTGLVLGLLLAYLPIFYLRFRAGRRLRAFTLQLPDVLTLLIGALRAGLGLSQAIDLLVRQAPEPAAKEFGRAARAISLGLPIQRALNDMADRVGSDDLDLVVTAMNVQYEMGGNLAGTLEVIAETVRDRIHIKREIRVFTAQQRFTGYALALLPVFVAAALFVIAPFYMRELFAPGMLFLPIAGAALMVVGFLVIRKILDIEV